MAIKILVVDDELDTAELFNQKYAKQIAENKYQFSFIDNGQSAIDLLKEKHQEFDVVLTDIQIPGVSGFEVMKFLDNPEFEIKAVVVTAYGDIDNLRKAMNSGAYDFSTKPIDFNDLASIIDRAAKQVESLREFRSSQSTLSNLKNELSISAALQQSFLPREFPSHPNVDVYAEMIPAVEIGGDFYDFFLLNDHQIGVAVADVSGKNISAALYMAIARTLLKATAKAFINPAICVEKTNEALCENNESSMFTTALYGILDFTTSEFHYVNAGHCNAILISNGTEVKEIPSEVSCALGVISEINYSAQKIKINEGDTILLYTDGISEAFDMKNEAFGVERILESLKSFADANKEASTEARVKDLVKEVRKFTNGAPQSDDMTILAVNLKKLGELMADNTKDINNPNQGKIEFENNLGSRNIDNESGQLVLANKITALMHIPGFINDLGNQFNVLDEDLFSLQLCLDELLTNIMSYGYPQSKEDKIIIDFKINKDHATMSISISDHGIAFNPLEKQDPNINLSTEERPIGGLGIYFIRQFMHGLSYERKNDTNVLSMSLKYRTKTTN